MINILVPKGHFLAADFPFLEDGVLGLPIPIGWGNIHNIVPFCVDVDDLRFKILDHAIAEISEIRSRGIPLAAGSYVEDLPSAEFTLEGSPVLTEGQTYYFALSGDYAINGTDYLTPILNSIHAAQLAYSIDNANLWTPLAGHQLFFVIFGKMRLSEEEQIILVSWGMPFTMTALRDAAARTRIGERFVCPDAPRGSVWYITKIRVYFAHPSVGAPAGNIWLTLFSGINPDVQVGMQGEGVPIPDADAAFYDLPFAENGEENDLQVDIEAPYPIETSAAEVLEGLFVDRLGKDPAILEPHYLADLAAKRTQELKVYVDREITVGDFIGKLEASVLFKFVPLQDGTFAAVVFESGEPAGTLHLRDIDFVEGTRFRVERDVSVVRQWVRLKYDEDPSTQVFKVAEVRNDLARLLYGNEESVEIETWLKEDADAAQIAGVYSEFFEAPQIRVVFSIHGLGLDLRPGIDKVKITKSRAPWNGGPGSFSGQFRGVLFRIMKLVKSPATNTTEITAVLDSQTYPGS